MVRIVSHKYIELLFWKEPSSFKYIFSERGKRNSIVVILKGIKTLPHTDPRHNLFVCRQNLEAPNGGIFVHMDRWRDLEGDALTD